MVAGLLVPVAVGPVIGEAIAGSLGWRLVFLVSDYLYWRIPYLPTCPSAGDASVTCCQWKPVPVEFRFSKVNWDPDTAPMQFDAKKQIDVFRPLKILISKQVYPKIVFLAINYAVWPMSIPAVSFLFMTRYDLTEIRIGMAFVGNGVGSMIVKSSFEIQSSARAVELEDTAPHTSVNQENFSLEIAGLRLIPSVNLSFRLDNSIFESCSYKNSYYVELHHHSLSFPQQYVMMTYLVDVFYDQITAASASLDLASWQYKQCDSIDQLDWGWASIHHLRCGAGRRTDRSFNLMAIRWWMKTRYRRSA
ncbi:hypothetical protein F1880_003194 [Penicillium rolfsii]|nr:hypothetical protein F1880_003194 [Penicillium rolfsii]